MKNDGPVLVINAGSSSLKLGLFAQRGDDVVALWEANVEGSASGEALAEGTRRMVAEVHNPVGIVAHRIVHGGATLLEHRLIDADVTAALRESADFAPLHVPVALRLIDAAEHLFEGVPQVACFDTAFHRTLPELARRLPIPQRWHERGVRRYGFHGLSCESIVHRFGADLPGRTIVAHLGSGASVTALLDGKSVDTSMGLTPTGGIVMGTRTGDLDPGVLVYLMRQGLDVHAIEQLVDHESGLAGLADGEHDMRKLEADPRHALAIAVFTASVKKTIAAYAAVLGGVDLVVFTGGIGEHSAGVRRDVCSGLGWMGVQLDPARNEAHAHEIASGAVRVCVVPSEEDAQIARRAFEVIATATSS